MPEEYICFGCQQITTTNLFSCQKINPISSFLEKLSPVLVNVRSKVIMGAQGILRWLSYAGFHKSEVRLCHLLGHD